MDMPTNAELLKTPCFAFWLRQEDGVTMLSSVQPRSGWMLARATSALCLTYVERQAGLTGNISEVEGLQQAVTDFAALAMTKKREARVIEEPMRQPDCVVFVSPGDTQTLLHGLLSPTEHERLAVYLVHGLWAYSQSKLPHLFLDTEEMAAAIGYLSGTIMEAPIEWKDPFVE